MPADREYDVDEEKTADASDADSDLEELQGDIAKFDESVRAFLASHQDEGGAPRSLRGGARGRGVRGPRKAAKPRGDITIRMAQANRAFLAGDYSRASDLVFEVIRINAETHSAWTTLAQIFREQGNVSKALSAMVYAAHLRDKDVSGWLQCASYALDTIQDDEEGNLHTARLCYSAALRANPANIDARLGKAIVCHRQGHLSAAIAEYNVVLKHRPYELDIVRKLAEACVDNKHAETSIPTAIRAYQRYFEHERDDMGHSFDQPPWHDVGIYVELFASTGRYHEAIQELKALSRWLIGRGAEEYWQDWQLDDREWDADDERRTHVEGFRARSSDPSMYGAALPQHLRARLAIYRLRVGNEEEAMKHLWWLDPHADCAKDFVSDFPFLAFDLAEELARRHHLHSAIRYYELLRDISAEPDATVLLHIGRCYLAGGEHATAEEYFLAAIDADGDSIDARIELANMYEKAREEEEALILAAEAMALREARGQSNGTQDSGIPRAMYVPIAPNLRLPGGRHAYSRRGRAIVRDPRVIGKSVIPPRFRPKRLAGPDKRRQDEQDRAIKLSQKYEIVRDLKHRIRSGRDDLIPEWKTSSKELIDDFRSLKKFYTWEKYLHFLGSKVSLEQSDANEPKTELSKMYERLKRTLAPQTESDKPGLSGMGHDNHQGISFDNWLELFLDYAISLAIDHRRDEAYQVCEAARDSTAFQTPEHWFMIYVAWGVCAIYTSDEERCVGTARQLMKDGAMSDSYRMFALLSNLCQSPVSWYTSGPAQKYILRQIKAMDDGRDTSHLQDGNCDSGTVTTGSVPLDTCLLMLYGHILFTSTSYTYALGYFLRARALDADNPMVNLSLGLAYVHYALKRQSTNRQYLLLQGQSFLSRYLALSIAQPGPANVAVAYYNIGRLYQLLGINYLAIDFYSKVEAQVATDSRPYGTVAPKSIATAPICEARTINYITHTLPQSCLPTSRASSEIPPMGSYKKTSVTSLSHEEANRDGPATAGATAASSPEGRDGEGDTVASPFMSFEDWKAMMLRKTGQDPQDLMSRKASRPRDDDGIPPEISHSGLGEEDEISLNFDSYIRAGDQQDVAIQRSAEGDKEHGLEPRVPSVSRSKDAGKTCKERFSYSSFDAGATVLKSSPGAKNAKAILVENKDSYLLLECASASKYVIVELSDDILIDTVVVANFEFFSSMIRHFRVSVSDRYPVKMDKWSELGTFEARNSRDIQPFLIQNPQIWAKYVRIEFLTHYGKEYYCPVSLLRVHGSRMVDGWKEIVGGRDEDTQVDSADAIEAPRVDQIGVEQSSSRVDSLVSHGTSGRPLPTSMDLGDTALSQCPPRSSTGVFQPAHSTCDSSLQHGHGPAMTASGQTHSRLGEGAERHGHLSEETGSPEEAPRPSRASTQCPTAPSSTSSATAAAETTVPTSKIKTLPPVDPASNSTATQPAGNADQSVSTTKVPSPSASSASKNRTSTATAPAPASPTVQEGFFKAVTKRLHQVESNLTLSLKYIEDQSRHMQETLQRSELKQLSKITSFLESLNKTVLVELRTVQDQYDQMWQSTVLALESQREQSQREIVALSTRLNLLADEVVFQKRMAIVQAVLLLSCLLLVIFSRGVPLPYLAPLSDQTNLGSYHQGVASPSGLFASGDEPDLLGADRQSADILRDPVSEDLRPGHDFTYPQGLPQQNVARLLRRSTPSSIASKSAHDTTMLEANLPHREKHQTHRSVSSAQPHSSRKPLPALPEDPCSP